MIPMTTVDLMAAYCKATGKYAMLIVLPDLGDVECSGGSVFDELAKAAPYLRAFEDGLEHGDVMGQTIADELGVMIFDTAEEMDQHYNQTVGDDGPTELNKYDGPVRVYALTCGPEGLRNENT